jgi:hypothetical protein
MRMPTLIPEMYALAKCGHFPVIARERTISMTMAAEIARRVRLQLSSIPNTSWPKSRMQVIRSGARKRLLRLKNRCHEVDGDSPPAVGDVRAWSKTVFIAVL